VFRPLINRQAGWFPDGRIQATAWLYEADAANRVQECCEEHLAWLEVRNRHAHGMIGSVLAAMFRLSYVLGLCKRQEEILVALDHVPAFQRPSLTMLLQDILPRPLSGVEVAEGPPDDYWK